jgi:hypothetical protein
VYAEKAEWCEDTSKDVMYEVKTGKSNVESLKATIAKEASNIDAQTAKIEELAGAIAMDEADLEAATHIRTKEEADFKAKETDLVETVDILERAIGIIEKEMKGGSFAQVSKNAHNMVEVFKSMVTAQSISSLEGEKLTALIQATQQDSDEEGGAPDPAVYENQSGGIMDVMNDLLEKSQGELDKARNTETTNIQNFEMLKQSSKMKSNSVRRRRTRLPRARLGPKKQKLVLKAISTSRPRTWLRTSRSWQVCTTIA